MPEMKSFIDGMPKADLHVHVEGTLEPELKFELARRNGIELPYESVEEVRNGAPGAKVLDVAPDRLGGTTRQPAFSFRRLHLPPIMAHLRRLSAGAPALHPPDASRDPFHQEDPLPDDFSRQFCYEGTPPAPGSYKIASQVFCGLDFPPILPLSTNEKTIDDAIDAPTHRVSGYTCSALGVLWAQRLLQNTWRTVWGGTVHPVDPTLPANEGLRKAIVLLTDGEDTHCGAGNEDCDSSPIGIARADACDETKAEGTEVFVVAAMHPDKIGDDFETSLADCSSTSPDPDRKYVFVNNSTKAELEAAFTDIANQLRTVRRSN